MGYSTKSVLFDGISQYGTAGNILGFEYTDDFSAACWCKTSTGAGIMMSRMCTQPGGNNFYRGWSLSGNGSVVLRNRNSTGDQIVVSGSNSIVDGDWHFVVATWKGNVTPVAADVSIYFDGMLEVPNVITDNLTATIVYPGEQFNVGARAGLVSFDDAFFDGIVDSAAVYDKTLSAAEVLWIYNVGNPRDLKEAGGPSNLVWWCRMGDNGTPPTLIDEVGSSDLTLVDSPTIVDDASEQTLYESTYEDPSNIPRYTWQQDIFPQDAHDPVYSVPPSFSLYTWQQTFFDVSLTRYLMRGLNAGSNFVHWEVTEEPDLTATYAPEPIPDLSTIVIVARW